MHQLCSLLLKQCHLEGSGCSSPRSDCSPACPSRPSRHTAWCRRSSIASHWTEFHKASQTWRARCQVWGMQGGEIDTGWLVFDQKKPEHSDWYICSKQNELALSFLKMGITLFSLRILKIDCTVQPPIALFTVRTMPGCAHRKRPAAMW